MNLNSVFFPAPKCSYDLETLQQKGELIWIPYYQPIQQQQDRKQNQSTLLKENQHQKLFYSTHSRNMSMSNIDAFSQQFYSNNFLQKPQTRIQFSNKPVQPFQNYNKQNMYSSQYGHLQINTQSECCQLPSEMDEFRSCISNSQQLIMPNSTKSYQSTSLSTVKNGQSSLINNNDLDEFANSSGINQIKKVHINNNIQFKINQFRSPQSKCNSKQVSPKTSESFIDFNDKQQQQNVLKVTRHIPCFLLRSGLKTPYILVYFHGNGEDIYLGYELVDHIRNNLNINIISMEYPGYGLYKGQPSEQQILQDTECLYNYLIKTLNCKNKHIIVMGRSIGSGPATWLAANKKVGALILLSPFTSLRAVVKHVAGSLSQYFVKERFVNIENIKKVECPTFIIHGQKDTLVPFEHSLQLHENCKGPCEINIPKNMNHTEFDFYDDLTKPLQSFLNRNGIDLIYMLDGKAPDFPQSLFQVPNSIQI